VPAGPHWLHEVKYDGYRIVARKAGEGITLFSRSGLDWTVRFPAIAKALLTLPAESALLDGEVAFVLPSGITDFKSLQEHIDSPHPAIRYFVFDLLSLDGRDLRKKSLKERRALLGRLMSAKGISNYLVYADYVEGSGPEFFREACEHGLEGIMSKRADAPYRSGRGKDWLKIKCTKGEEFVIGGYSRSDVRGKPFSSLLLGTFEDGKLSYAGKVGTGFDSGDFTSLAKTFKSLERSRSPFEEVPAPERKRTVWLEPKLVAQIAYTEKTRDKRLRHPSYQGLREDKPAREVHREEAGDEEASMAKTRNAPAKKSGDPTFGGITLTNPDRVYYPDIGLTKLDLARYYEAVAPYMLPYVVRRPISLVRCPEGIDKEHFFQRHAMKGMSKAIKEVHIAGGESKKKYLYIDGGAGLFGLVQIGVLEIHDWGVSLDHIPEHHHVHVGAQQRGPVALLDSQGLGESPMGEVPAQPAVECRAPGLGQSVPGRIGLLPEVAERLAKAEGMDQHLQRAAPHAGGDLAAQQAGRGPRQEERHALGVHQASGKGLPAQDRLDLVEEERGGPSVADARLRAEVLLDQPRQVGGRKAC